MCCFLFYPSDSRSNGKLSVDWRVTGGFTWCNFNPCLTQSTIFDRTFGWLVFDDDKQMIGGLEPGPGLKKGLLFLLFPPVGAIFMLGMICCFDHTGYHFYFEPDTDRVVNQTRCKVSHKFGCCWSTEILDNITNITAEHEENEFTVENTNDDGQATGGYHTSVVRRTWLEITHGGGVWRSPVYDAYSADLDEISVQARHIVQKAKDCSIEARM